MPLTYSLSSSNRRICQMFSFSRQFQHARGYCIVLFSFLAVSRVLRTIMLASDNARLMHAHDALSPFLSVSPLSPSHELSKTNLGGIHSSRFRSYRYQLTEPHSRVRCHLKKFLRVLFVRIDFRENIARKLHEYRVYICRNAIIDCQQRRGRVRNGERLLHRRVRRVRCLQVLPHVYNIHRKTVHFFEIFYIRRTYKFANKNIGSCKSESIF